jgi:hypothetical protein
MAQMTLNDLVSQLQAIYGDQLVAVALYGSTARGEHLEKYSDLNALVVVERITMESLRKEAPVARAWREAGNPPPLTMTRAEWMGSSDIFPIEYADILAHHQMIAGTLPLAGIEVDKADLRLQLEHEAMSKLLRLRHAILLVGKDKGEQRRLLEDAVSTFLVLMRATLRLMNVTPSADSEGVCGLFHEKCGIDTAAILRVVKHTRKRDRITDAELDPLLERFLATAQGLVAYLDRYSH